jgi:hypothetical protein
MACICDGIAELDKLAERGAAKVELVWKQYSPGVPGFWEWDVSIHQDHDWQSIGGGTAPGFLGAVDGVFEMLNKREIDHA